MPGDRSIQIILDLPDYGAYVPEQQRHKEGDIVVAGTPQLVTSQFATLRRGEYRSRKPITDKKLALIHVRNIPDFIIKNFSRLTFPVVRRNLNKRPDEKGGLEKLRQSRFNVARMHSRVYRKLKRDREVTVSWDQLKTYIMDNSTNRLIEDCDFDG